jgi:hypothetical protein
MTQSTTSEDETARQSCDSHEKTKVILYQPYNAQEKKFIKI